MHQTITNIIIIKASKDISGGYLHINELAKFWEMDGINVFIGEIEAQYNFNLINNIKIGLLKIYDVIDKFRLSEEKLQNADVIISASPYPQDLFTAIKLSKFYNKPLICYVHHVVPSVFFHPFKRGFFRVILNILYNKYLFHLFREYNIGIFLDHKEFYNKNDIPVFETLCSVEPKELKKEKIYDLYYIGGLSRKKGFYDLIKALKLLNSKPKVAIIGHINNKIMIKINKKLKKYNLMQNFTFFGFIDNYKKEEILNSSKIFISPSYEEGWSLSVMEAAYLGIPIIAYKLIAYNYLKNNYYSVTPGNVKELAKTINYLINNIDKSRSKTENAKNSVRKYNYKDIASQQLIYINNFINTRK